MIEKLEVDGFVGWDGAARFSGLSVSTLKRLVRAGQLRMYRLKPGRTLLCLDEIRALIEASAVPTDNAVAVI